MWVRLVEKRFGVNMDKCTCEKCGCDCHCNWDSCNCGCDVCDCGTTKSERDIPSTFVNPNT